MNFKKWLLEMRNATYDFSSAQVDVPNPLAKKIIEWGNKTIDDDEIFVSDTDPNFGRENEMHVTVLYGIHSEYPSKIKRSLKETSPVKVKLGKMTAFTNPEKFDVVVIEVISKDLETINRKLRNELPFTNKYDEYRPHVTIAYVKNGIGEKYKNINKWEGEEFECENIVFSSKNGTKERIKLVRSA